MSDLMDEICKNLSADSDSDLMRKQVNFLISCNFISHRVHSRNKLSSSTIWYIFGTYVETNICDTTRNKTVYINFSSILVYDLYYDR